jgi:ABC-type ATPase involved in cell division
VKLERKTEPLVSNVKPDPTTEEAIAPFDLDMSEPTKFYPYKMPELPKDYNIGLIVGSSGSGKSLLMNELNELDRIVIGNTYNPFYAIAGHFESAEDAREKLYAVGLNSIPKWRLPITALSNGEQHRAYIARNLYDGATVDEFTSTIDRDVAISLSVSVGRYLRAKNIKQVVFATCHRDIVAPLRPDWIIDTDAGEFKVADTSPPRWWAEMTGEKQGSIHIAWN